MWTIIYIAPSLKVAEKIQDRLSKEGFLVKLRSSTHDKQFEILVPEGELEEIKETLSDILQ